MVYLWPRDTLPKPGGFKQQPFICPGLCAAGTRRGSDGSLPGVTVEAKLQQGPLSPRTRVGQWTRGPDPRRGGQRELRQNLRVKVPRGQAHSGLPLGSLGQIQGDENRACFSTRRGARTCSRLSPTRNHPPPQTLVLSDTQHARAPSKILSLPSPSRHLTLRQRPGPPHLSQTQEPVGCLYGLLRSGGPGVTETSPRPGTALMGSQGQRSRDGGSRPCPPPFHPETQLPLLTEED